MNSPIFGRFGSDHLQHTGWCCCNERPEGACHGTIIRNGKVSIMCVSTVQRRVLCTFFLNLQRSPKRSTGQPTSPKTEQPQTSMNPLRMFSFWRARKSQNARVNLHHCRPSHLISLRLVSSLSLPLTCYSVSRDGQGCSRCAVIQEVVLVRCK